MTKTIVASRLGGVGVIPQSGDGYKVITVKNDLTGYVYSLPVCSFSSTERDALQNVPTNLILYNTTVSSFQKFNGTSWDNIGGSGGGGSFSFSEITGNPYDNNLLAQILDGKEPVLPEGAAGQYLTGEKTFVTLDKAAVGLNNVDNTSDANKPISSATQSALDAKENTLPSGDPYTFLNQSKNFSKPNLLKLGDVSIESISNGQSIKWNQAVGKFEPFSVDQVNSVGNAVSFFFSNTNSSISGYKTLSESYSGDSTGVIESVSTTSTGQTLIKAFATPAIGLTEINGGIYSFTLGLSVSTLASASTVSVEVYKRTSAGVETLLGQIESVTIDTAYDPNDIINSFSIAGLEVALNAVSLNLDDVLVVKLFAKTTHTNAVTVYFMHSQSVVASHCHTPIVKSHNQLPGLNEGDYQHLSAAQKAAATRIADDSQSGLLSPEDHLAFSSKQAALISGTNIKTINGQSVLGPGDLTIDSGSISWNSVSGTSQNLIKSNGYIANNIALTTFTLPTTAAVGDTFEIVGAGAGGWRIAQNANQYIRFSTAQSTTGTGGSVASTNRYNSCKMICEVANVGFRILNAVGDLNLV